MQANKQFETFNSGIAEFCEIEEKNIIATIIKPRFGDKTVGISRFYEAKVAGSKVERLISIPFNEVISKENIVIIASKQYEIDFIQTKFDTLPKTLLVTLSEMVIKKKDMRT